MKKFFFSAALASMMFAGCQNEVIENQSNENGEFFSLEVVKGMSSRTELNGKATNWSKGDKIYVSGEGGKVTGVLTLEGDGGSANGKFTGYIFGGKPAKLQHIVFPVPQDGKIDMSKRNPEKLDAPMVGTIEDGAFKSLNNVGGLLAIQMEGSAGEEFGLKATSTEVNMTGGSYEFDPVEGTLKYVPANKIAWVQVSEDDYAYIPVATVANVAVDGTSPANVELTSVQITDAETDEVIIESTTPVEITTGEIFGDDPVNEKTGLNLLEVKTLDEYNAAYLDSNNAGVKFGADFTFDTWNSINTNPSKDFLVDLNGHNLTVTSYTTHITTKLKIKNGTVNSQMSVENGHIECEGITFEVQNHITSEKGSVYTKGSAVAILKNCIFNCNNLTQKGGVDPQIRPVLTEYGFNGKLVVDGCEFKKTNQNYPYICPVGNQAEISILNSLFNEGFGCEFLTKESKFTITGNVFMGTIGIAENYSGIGNLSSDSKKFINDILDNNTFKGEHKFEAGWPFDVYIDNKF